MKNLKFLTAVTVTALVLFSCKKEEQVDCNCDRVASHTKFFMPGGATFGSYITINDCSEVQSNGDWASQNGDTEPVDGECY